MRHSSAAALASQFYRFLWAGGLAAAANFGSRFLFSEFVSFDVAVALAFLVGLSTGFALNRRYVFTLPGNSLPSQLGWYLLVNLLALAQTWLVSVYGAAWLAGRMELETAQASAHLAGIMLPVITSYFGHRYLTFPERRDARR